MITMAVTITLFVDVEEATTEDEAEHILRQVYDAELWAIAHDIQYEYREA